MQFKIFPILILVFTGINAYAKEVALTFDDAPKASSLHYTSVQRTNILVGKLKELEVPQVMIFANACNGRNVQALRAQLNKYAESGNLIGNHTCSHVRLDRIGFEAFSADAERGGALLGSLIKGQKYFRYPFLNEGSDPTIRDKMRQWLLGRGYLNASISGDNEDPTFSAKINRAKELKKKIDYQAIKNVFVDHVVSSLECNDALAIEYLGRSPKHVLLLHEADATVMFLDSLVEELRKRGWKLVRATEAYGDPLYREAPKNTYSGFGIIAQMVFEISGKKKTCYDYSALVTRLNGILDLN